MSPAQIVARVARLRLVASRVPISGAQAFTKLPEVEGLMQKRAQAEQRVAAHETAAAQYRKAHPVLGRAKGVSKALVEAKALLAQLDEKVRDLAGDAALLQRAAQIASDQKQEVDRANEEIQGLRGSYERAKQQLQEKQHQRERSAGLELER